MKRDVSVLTWALGGLILVMAACDEEGEAADGGRQEAADAAVVDVPGGQDVGPDMAIVGPALIVRIDGSIDGAGHVKATSIARAELLDTAGAVVKIAKIDRARAVFFLGGLAPGDYFIRINGLGDDLVPTRIVDPTAQIAQAVGTKLRASVIGDVEDPTFVFKTWSRGQPSNHRLVKYSDGSAATPERYGYVLIARKDTPPKLEVRVLGTGAELTSFSTTGAAHPFDTWVQGSRSHGSDGNFGRDDSRCDGCHGTLTAKAANFAAIKPAYGWCYRCHYGRQGDGQGMIDPAQ